MKILKYLFFLLLIFIIAGAIYIATKDGDYHIEETSIINAPVPVVFNEVNNLTNWEAWGPWSQETDDMVIKHQQTNRGEGGGFSWKSDNLGDGSLSTIKVNQNEAIEQDVNFKMSMAETRSNMYWYFEEVEEGTKVTVGFEGKQSFREKLAFSLTEKSIPEVMRPRLQRSLERLNNALVNKMSVYSINVDGLTTHGGGFYMYNTTATKISQVPTRMQKMLTELRNYMDTNNITRQGYPFVLYNNWDEQNNSAIYSTGIFTPSLVITPAESDILNGMMPVQQVIKTTLKGDVQNLQEAWDVAYQYLADNNLTANEESQPFEVYKTDFETTPNPANWVTEIFIPIQTAPVNPVIE